VFGILGGKILKFFWRKVCKECEKRCLYEIPISKRMKEALQIFEAG